MIGIVLTLSSGCVSGDGAQGGTVVSLHGANDIEELTLDGSLKAIMRARSQATTGDLGDAAWLLDADGATDQRCVSDDEGHPVCCDESAAGACCTHRGPSGDVRVCL